MAPDDLLAVLLLLLIGLAFGAIAMLSWFIIYQRRKEVYPPPVDRSWEETPRETSFVVSPLRAFWRRPACWLAIRGHNLAAVQAALGLSDAQPCSWSEGLSGGRQFFISPPFNGWMLVFGAGLPDPAEDIDDCFRFLMDLSRRVGQVQMFKADESLQHHAWACVQAGRVVRAYAWAGKTLWHQGMKTAAEIDLELNCFGYGESSSATVWGANELLAANVEKVPQLASRWSVNPSAIDPRFMEASRGVAGWCGKRL